MRLSQQPSHFMTIAPTLQEALHILQLPQLDLLIYLQTRAEENPLLDLSLQSSKQKIPPQKPLSFFAHLEAQIQETLPLSDHGLARKFIEELDERGYLTRSTKELSSEWGVFEDKLNSVLKVLKTFSPKGVFANDLQECLLLQTPPHRLTHHLLKNHYSLLLKRNYKALEKLFDRASLKKAFKELSLLSMRPKDAYIPSLLTPIFPDLAFILEDTIWHIIPKDEELFHLSWNEKYLQIQTKNREEKNTLNLWKTEGKWLFRTLKHRKRCLLQIGTLLLQRQRDFFEENGPLLELSKEQIAKQLGMHLSTLFRAISGKYIETPQGTLPLKALFGTSLAQQSAKEALKQMLNEEGPFLSDQILVERLQMRGTLISRRTLNKYRKELL